MLKKLLKNLLLNAQKDKYTKKLALYKNRENPEQFDIGFYKFSNFFTFGKSYSKVGGFAVLKDTVGLRKYAEEIRDILDEYENKLNKKNYKGELRTEIELQKDFGFSSVKTSRAIKQAEKDNIITNTYNGLKTLSEILGVPMKSMSLGGEMGLTLGFTGNNSTFGQYKATIKNGKLSTSIGLSRESGSSLAHEWWHALDHYLGRKYADGDYNSYISSYSKEARQELKESIKNIKEYIANSDILKRAFILDGYKQKYYATNTELTARGFEIFCI